jgi:hypothetical protein
MGYFQVYSYYIESVQPVAPSVGESMGESVGSSRWSDKDITMGSPHTTHKTGGVIRNPYSIHCYLLSWLTEAGKW